MNDRGRRIRPNQGGSPREGATKVTIRSKSSKASATTYSSRNDKGTPESKAFQSIRFGKWYANQSSSQPKTGEAKQTGNDTSTISSRNRFENSSNFLQCKSSSSTNPKARAEIINDYLRGYILFPQLEHNASAHFVNTTDLAKKVGTVNIHALLSH